MQTEQPAGAGPALSDVLGPVPRWWHCDTHGPGNHTAWGCPECVREMRSEREVLARWMAEACGVLFSVEEEAEDGESLRMLRERGLRLVRAVLQPTGA